MVELRDARTNGLGGLCCAMMLRKTNPLSDLWCPLGSMLIAGLSFWAPNAVLFPRGGSDDDFFVKVTFACPLSLLAVYGAAVWYTRKRPRVGCSCALFGLVGIWVTGPWSMSLAAILAGGPGLHEIRRYIALAWMSLCPPLTFYLSCMQENVFALILATVLLPICHWTFERGRWFVPPGLKRRLHAGLGRPTA